MGWVTLTMLVAFFRWVCAQEPVARYASDSTSEHLLLDKFTRMLAFQFDDRVLDASSFQPTNLDTTTAGKTVSSRASGVARHAFPHGRSVLHQAEFQRHFDWEQRRPTHARAEADEKEDASNEGYKFGDITKGILKAGVKREYKFGDMTKAAVEAATGNTDYEFGDMTKGAAQAAVDAAGQAVEAGAKAKEVATEIGKEITGDENYQVGDMTKTAAKGAAEAAAEAATIAAKEAAERASQDSEKLKSAADAAGKVITEDEGYQFGDITKGILKGAKDMVDKAIDEQTKKTE